MDINQDNTDNLLMNSLDLIDTFLEIAKLGDCPIHQWLAVIMGNIIITVFSEINNLEKEFIDPKIAFGIIYNALQKTSANFYLNTIGPINHEVH